MGPSRKGSVAKNKKSPGKTENIIINFEALANLVNAPQNCPCFEEFCEAPFWGGNPF